MRTSDFLTLSVVGVCILLSGTLAAAPPPKSFKLEYSLKRDGQTIGRVSDVFIRNGSRYRIESEAQAAGLAALFVKGPLRMTSEGEIGPSGLRPAKFERVRNGKTSSAIFDWNAARVTTAENGSAGEEPLAPGTQDRLSAIYQFMFAPPRGATIQMPMTSGKKPVDYMFERGKRERITTAAGSFNTVKLTRKRLNAGGDDEGVELWLVPSRNHLPVRIKLREDGALYEQDLLKADLR